MTSSVLLQTLHNRDNLAMKNVKADETENGGSLTSEPEALRVHDDKHGVDIFRDTPVRYLGYANEVGEAFRAQVPVNAVRMTYLIASSYVCADAFSKGKEAASVNWPDSSQRQAKILHAVGDTIIWQGLASVIIPGFTINRICYISSHVLRKVSNLPTFRHKWTVTMIGLASIPLIIKPIDRSVDWLMNRTLRKWYGIGPKEKDIVHHKRN